MSKLYYPLNSLIEGHWFKLICGASFQHLPAVRNLTLAYALAGADCIDVAADPAVIEAAKEALQSAAELAKDTKGRKFAMRGRPWLMVSLNDGEDPHFRKAEFNPAACPPDCPRPCEKICPAEAIVFNQKHQNQGKSALGPHPWGEGSGVIDQRCYGCGRCVPVCPVGHIVTRSYVFAPTALASVVLSSGVDAIEIHTQVGREQDFRRLWQAIAPRIGQLKLVAISCPDGEDLIDYLRYLYDMISPLPCPLIWQTDGRPMSGDIGTGTTRAAVKLGQKVLAAGLPGFVQLAGGTNHHTVAKLQAAGLLKAATGTPPGNISGEGEKIAGRYIAGVAYGSYARVLLGPVLDQLEGINPTDTQAGDSKPTNCLEDSPQLLEQGVNLASSLVSQLKIPLKLQQTSAQEAAMNYQPTVS